jgi:hypothetical protein
MTDGNWIRVQFNRIYKHLLDKLHAFVRVFHSQVLTPCGNYQAVGHLQMPKCGNEAARPSIQTISYMDGVRGHRLVNKPSESDGSV